MDSNQLAERRTTFAQDRTTFAEDRTVLAAERTFAAWLRTGLAFLASGLAAPRFLHDVMGSLELRALATLLLGCAVACFAAAAWRDTRVRLRLPAPHIRLLPRAFTLGIAGLLILMSIPAVVLEWTN